jgi:hypothetical protein
MGQLAYTVTDALLTVGMSAGTYLYRKKRGDEIPLPDLQIGRRRYYSPGQLEALRRYYEAHREWVRQRRTVEGIPS